MREDVLKGHTPTADRLVQLSKIDKYNKYKGTLVNVLEENEKIMQAWKFEKRSKQLNLIFKAADMAKIPADRYQMLNSMLQANGDFLNLLEILKKSQTSEVREAADELSGYYSKAINGEVNILLSALVDSSVTESGDALRDWILDKNPIAKATNDLIASWAQTGAKIDVLEKLRLSVAISYTLDKKLQDSMDYYKSNKSPQNIDAIYKFMPYIFELRKDNEDYLCEYQLLLNSNNKANNAIQTENIDLLLKTFKDTLYKDLEGYTYTTGNVKVGEYVLFGKYCGEPILWKCVDNSSGSMLVSEYVLCEKAYDAAESGVSGEGSDAIQIMGSNVWSNSNLREWLNSEDQKVVYSTMPPTKKAVNSVNPVTDNGYADEAGFLNNFTQDEIKKILPVAHNDVTDKVFILSKDEADSYLGSDSKKSFSKKQGSLTDYWDYWTRTPKPNAKVQICVEYIYGNGILAGSAGQGFVRDSFGGVVPALKLKSDIYKSGKGTKGEPWQVK